MSRLAPADLIVIFIYLAGTTSLALWFARRQRDLRTYFVGERNVPWWLILASIVATETSTVTFLSVPGLAYNRQGGDMTFLQLSLGYIIGRILVAWLLLPQYVRGELYSAYQVLRQRFNPAVQRTASGIFLLTRTVADGLRLFLTGLLLHSFTDWSIEFSVLVMGIVTIFYTYLGGIQAVIWTDLIQLVVYLLGAVVAAVFILNRIPGGLEEFFAVGREAGKFAVFDLTPDPGLRFTLWAGVIGGAFFSMASHGADQLMVQRYLCSRSLAQARTALVLSGFVVLLQFVLFLLIGIGLYVLWSRNLIYVTDARNNDEVFGLFIVRYLPVGLVGLVVAAVLAAAMSTLSSSLNSSSTAFLADFYRPIRPGRTEEHYLVVSRAMTVFWGLAQIAVALGTLWLSTEQSIINHVLAVAGFSTGMILGLFLLGSLKRPVKSQAALIGLVAGFFAVLAVWLPSLRGQALLAWPWYAPVGTLVTVGVALLVNRLGNEHGPSRDRGPQPGLDESR
jgi:SSS family solute:Na+ symporter